MFGCGHKSSIPKTENPGKQPSLAICQLSVTERNFRVLKHTDGPSFVVPRRLAARRRAAGFCGAVCSPQPADEKRQGEDGQRRPGKVAARDLPVGRLCAVCAGTAEGEYLLRLRLYELENRLDPQRFVRISHAEIVNLDKVRCFDLNLAGTICIRLADGSVTYVSRRYVSKIKQLLGV